METNEETQTPETPAPQTPFIELNNQITPCENIKIDNKDCENKQSTQSTQICCTYKKLLRFVFIIFMVIINYSPLVSGIIELILRKGDEVIYEVFIGIEIGCYGLGTIYLIIMIFKGTEDQIAEAIGYMAGSLIIVYILEILLYFSSLSYESDHPDEFVNFIGKFRIFGFFAIIGIYRNHFFNYLWFLL